MKTSKLPNIGLLFAVVFFLVPHIVFGADLLIAPGNGSFPMGQEFSVKVLVSPGSESVNAADGTVTFDKDVLSVTSVTKDGSAFSLWTADPAFSNSAGTVTFSGGTPSGFSKEGTVLTITFKGTKTGTGKIAFANASVLAADGKGTNVFGKGAEATFTITEGAATPPPPPPDPEPDPEPTHADPVVEGGGGDTPAAPSVTSPTHAKEELWYATSTVIMTWKAPQDVTGIRTLLSEKDDAKPNETQKASATSTTMRTVKDGTWYFYIQFKNEFGWGQVTKRTVNIDTVAPKEFEISLLEGASGPAKFAFTAQDDLSGVDRYEIVLGGTVVATVKSSDMSDGTTLVPPQGGGPQTVVVRAYDKAGNMRESQKELTLPVVNKPTKGAAAEETAPVSPWTSERIALIVFAVVIGALAASNYYTRRNFQRGHAHILAGVLEVRDKNNRVFSAMREEFEQMVNNFDPKPQLTPQERELLENIKEVLDLSEEVIDTSIEELKKVVRGS